MTVALASLFLLIQAQSGQAVLDAEPKLAVAVTLTSAAESVLSVCKHLSDKTGAQIEPSKALADDLVILYADAIPARDLMSRLASHFGWTWTRDGTILRLTQSEDSKKAESASMRESILRGYRSSQAVARKALADAAKSDPEATAKRIAELDAQIANLSGDPAGDTEFDPVKYKQIAPLYEERARLLEQSDPAIALANTVFASLSDDKLLELDRRGRLVFSYRPTQWQYPFTQESAKMADRLIASLSRPPRLQDSPSVEGEGVSVPASPPLDPRRVGTVRVELVSRSGRTFAPATASANVVVIARDGSILDSNSAFLSQGSEDVETPPTGPTKTRLDEPLQAPADLKQELSPTTMGPQAFFKKISQFLTQGGRTDPLAPQAQVLCRIAAVAKVNLIADAYDSHLAVMAESGFTGNSAAALFNSYSRMAQAVWTLDGNWVSVRTRDWALARAGTVPRDIVFQYKDQFLSQSGLTIEQLAGLAGKVTNRQAGSFVTVLYAGFNWMTIADSEALCGLYGMRLWDSLSQSQRGALSRGGTVPYFALSPASKSMLAEFLYRSSSSESIGDLGNFPGQYYGEGEGISTPDAPEPPSEAKDTEITQLLPSGIPSNAFLTLEAKSMVGLAINMEYDELRMPLIIGVENYVDMRSAIRREDQPDPMGINLENLRPAEIQTLRLKVNLAPGLTREFQAAGGAGLPLSTFGKLTSLPAEIQAKIQAAAERKRKLREGGAPPPD
jgi:hypothetical protein